MDIWLIAGVILLGLLIVVIEVFFLPGTTVFGIVGGIIQNYSPNLNPKV